MSSERIVRPVRYYLEAANDFLYWAADDAHTGGSHPADWTLMLPRVDLALRVADAHIRMAKIVLAAQQTEDQRASRTQNHEPPTA